MRARAVVFTAPRSVEVRDVELDPPRDGDVVIRTTASGISGGTELLAYRGEIEPDLPLDERLGALGGTFTYPFRYGYSSVGIVERGARDVQEGSMAFAFYPHQDVAVVPADDAIAVDDVEPRIATMFPIVETGLQISLDAGDVSGRTVVVVGQGPIGLVSALLLARRGAEVIAVEPVPSRRRMASELGIRAHAPGAVGEAVTEATGGAGVPLVIEASGAPTALADALSLAAHEGTVLVASWYGSKRVMLPLGGAFHRRRLTIRSTQVSTIPERLRGEWTIERRRAEARALLSAHPLAPLATHAVPFDDAASAYEIIDRGENDAMHVALTYR
ncbi:MAG TPA: zinc-binding alcohol dehydrogenase [Actinomycetota bacterium]|nr:zinc-binding alcohol dehydrogenase [Actinomycetota bacterium]